MKFIRLPFAIGNYLYKYLLTLFLGVRSKSPSSISIPVIWQYEGSSRLSAARFDFIASSNCSLLNGFAALHPTRTLIRLVGSVLRDYLEK